MRNILNYSRSLNLLIYRRMSPNQADKPKNAYKVRLALEEYYAKQRSLSIKPRFKVGSYVRVAKSNSYPFKRSYDEQFDTEVYTISGIKTNLFRPLYELRNAEGVQMDDR